MKKYWLWLITALITVLLGINIACAGEKSTSLAISAKQRLVEQSLRPPITFSDETLQTYSVEERLEYFNVPGISFALIENWQVEWASAYGVLDANSESPVTVETIFQAASIAKPVTAFGVMRMQQHGEVDINVPVQGYLTSLALAKGAQTEDAVVTFKNILDHSSGLIAGGYQGYKLGATIPTDVQTFLGQPPAVNKPVRVEFIPGTDVRYSGAGYTLAEIALRDIFQKPFELIMDKWVLTPLALQHSSFQIDYPRSPGISVALGHDNLGRPIEGGWRIHPEQAAAGLWSTPTDLAKLALEMGNAYHGKSKLLSQAAAREMLTPVMPDKDLSSSFGGQPAMTFIVSGHDDDFLFNHGGGTIGYRCLMVFYPNTGKGAVFMTNSDVGYSVGVEMLRAASAVYDWPHYKGNTLARRKVDVTEQTKFIGTYVFDAGWQVEIINTTFADGIAIKFPNDDVYPLTGVVGDNRYVHRDTGVEAEFSDSNQQIELLLYGQRGLKRH